MRDCCCCYNYCCFHDIFAKWWWNKIQHTISKWRKRVRERMCICECAHEYVESKQGERTHLLLLHCMEQLLGTNSMVCKSWQHITRGNGNNSIWIIWHLLSKVSAHMYAVALHHITEKYSGEVVKRTEKEREKKRMNPFALTTARNLRNKSTNRERKAQFQIWFALMCNETHIRSQNHTKKDTYTRRKGKKRKGSVKRDRKRNRES